jgi:hypothetical protein
MVKLLFKLPNKHVQRKYELDYENLVWEVKKGGILCSLTSSLSPGRWFREASVFDKLGAPSVRICNLKRKFILSPMCIFFLYFRWKFLHVYICILCVHAKVSRKNDTSCAPCKITKKSLMKNSILALKFVFLHRTHKCQFFMKQHCEHTQWGDLTSEIFVLEFFNISK